MKILKEAAVKDLGAHFLKDKTLHYQPVLKTRARSRDAQALPNLIETDKSYMNRYKLKKKNKNKWKSSFNADLELDNNTLVDATN